MCILLFLFAAFVSPNASATTKDQTAVLLQNMKFDARGLLLSPSTADELTKITQILKKQLNSGNIEKNVYTITSQDLRKCTGRKPKKYTFAFIRIRNPNGEKKKFFSVSLKCGDIYYKTTYYHIPDNIFRHKPEIQWIFFATVVEMSILIDMSSKINDYNRVYKIMYKVHAYLTTQYVLYLWEKENIKINENKKISIQTLVAETRKSINLFQKYRLRKVQLASRNKSYQQIITSCMDLSKSTFHHITHLIIDFYKKKTECHTAIKLRIKLKTCDQIFRATIPDTIIKISDDIYRPIFKKNGFDQKQVRAFYWQEWIIFLAIVLLSSIILFIINFFKKVISEYRETRNKLYKKIQSVIDDIENCIAKYENCLDQTEREQFNAIKSYWLLFMSVQNLNNCLKDLQKLSCTAKNNCQKFNEEERQQEKENLARETLEQQEAIKDSQAKEKQREKAEAKKEIQELSLRVDKYIAELNDDNAKEKAKEAKANALSANNPLRIVKMLQYIIS